MIAALAGALALLALAAGPAAAAECGNEAIREQQHAAFLPECRAWELVSPPGAIPAYTFETGQLKATRASTATEGAYAGAVAWPAKYPVPGNKVVAKEFLSTRGSSGWTTFAATPTYSSGGIRYFECMPFVFLSPSLEAGVISANRETDSVSRGEEEYCPTTEPYPLVSGEAEGVQNLFLRDNRSEPATYSLVNPAPMEGPPAIATFQDGSSTLSTVLFSEEAKLTPEAPAGEDLYDETGGELRLVSTLPSGTPIAGRVVGAAAHTVEFEGNANKAVGGQAEGAAVITHAMSSDGSRVVFEAEGEGKLYLRVNATQPQSAIAAGHETALNGEQCAEAAKACTIQLDASQASGPGGSAAFLWANEAGTKFFFTDQASAELTSDTQESSGANLYEYKLPAGASTGTLTDLTPVAKADVLGFSGLGESEEGKAIAYFVSEGALSGANPEGHTPTEGKPNLYVLAEGAVAPTFLATLSAARDTNDWAAAADREATKLQARVSPNGAYIAFTTVRSIPTLKRPAGYDNIDASTGEPDSEIYVYDHQTGQLACASCDPTGAPPHGSTALRQGAPAAIAPGPYYLQRSLLDDGTVIFDTAEPLLPSLDSNGVTDVYQYRAGALSLISGGASARPSSFVEASPDGRNIYFVTTQALSGRDTDNVLSLYDARKGGGFAQPAASASCDEAAECQGMTTGPAAFAPPPSVSFAGLGNLKPPATEGKATQPTKGSGKARAERRRKALRKALRRCRRIHRHNRHKRRVCTRLARKRYGAKAKGARRHARSRRHQHGHGHRHHHHNHGGAR